MPNLPNNRRRPRWLIAAAISIAVLIAAAIGFAPVLSSYVREKMQSLLRERFDSDLQIQNLQVSLFPSVSLSGESVVFRKKGHSGDPPLIRIAKFTGRGNILGLLARRVSSVHLEGLEIQIPPKDPNRQTHHGGGGGGTPYFVVDEIIADGTTLTRIPRNKDKDPLVFDIKTLRIRGASSTSPLDFDAVLTNAKPPGEIKSRGKFGPWDKEEPGGTPVSGDYTFRNADLGVFKGISGMLSSDGSYKGALGRIEVAGHTDVPDFVVSVARNPVHLTTDFQAIVDGTSGDTYLQPVTAKFGKSTIVANGSVEGRKGVKGKTVTLDATVKEGRLEDMLLLGVKAKTPPLSGAISFRSKILIPPGDADVAQKLQLDGAFVVESAKFSKLNVQEKVNQLSHRGKGDANDAEAPTVASDFQGKFTLNQGVLALRDLSFTVPGVSIALNGKFGLKDQSMNFRGTATLEAKLSETTTGWKSLLLKAVDPFFKGKGPKEGAVIPIKITGTRDEPSFGLDVFR